MPGELFWNAPIGKDEDSDQDTFVLMSSSDFDTPNSLDNSKDFNNSFDIPVSTTMATKYSAGGTLDQPGPSGLNDDSKENRLVNEPSTSFSGLGPGDAAGSGGGGGGGDDRRGSDRRQIPGDGNLEDDSHEPIASGSSTSSSSIPVLAPVDPALDINTADLWPNNGDRNGHSDESGLSQATTAVVSDADSVQNDSIVNPLLGATSSTSSSSAGSKNIMKSTSGCLDVSSASLSTLSSNNSIISSYDDKKNSSSDTSLSRIDTSAIDISGDHGVEGILTNEGKLEDFHSSHIDIFNNSGDPCTSTPSDEIGILEFHDQSNLLSTQDDNDVIPSTQEDLQKIAFAVPSVPLLSSSSSKRKADNVDDQSGAKKISRLSLKIPPLNTPSPILPVPVKKSSERALALDTFKKYIERGLDKSVPATVHRPPWERLIDELNSEENDFNSELTDKDAAPTGISRKLLFDSSQSSSNPSSGDSTFKPIDVVNENADVNDESLTAAIVQETCGDLLSKVLNVKVEDATKPNLILESQVIESSQEKETQSVIESSQPSSELDSVKRDATNFELRFTPTLLDVESQYFPFEEDSKLTNTESQSNKIEAKSVENIYEVPESEVSDAEQVKTCSKQDSSELKIQMKQDSNNEKAFAIITTPESQVLPEKMESEGITDAIDDDSQVTEESLTLNSKRELENTDEEVNPHKRRKFNEFETSSFVSSTSGNSTEITSVYKVAPKKDDSAKQDAILNVSNKRDQEVQTIEIEDKEDEFRNNNVNNDCVRRKTVIIKRIVIEEFIRNGRVYKKTTEEINDDPIVQEYHKDDNDTQAYSGSPNVEKSSPKERLKKSNSSSCLSSTERSGTSSGWLGDLSASASKSSNSSSGTKASSKGITPRLAICPINESMSSGSSSGMKTLRSVRRRQFSEFKKTLHLSPDKSITENEEVAFSTPKHVSESPKVKKKDVKSHKHVDSKKSAKSAVAVEKSINKRKTFKRRPKNEPMVRKLVNEESCSPLKKPSKSSDNNKTPPPREQLILKLNLKSSSIVIPSRMDDSRTLKPGVRVMAKYRDGYYYPGRAVDQERADRWKILYDDGDTRSIRMENILVVELLPVGQSIYVLSQDGFYDSAIIYGYTDINGEIQYAIEMDEGSKRQVKQSAVILTTDQAACMEKLPLGTMHGYTSICLDNIIDGKRRSRDLPSDSSSKSSRRERASNSANEESDHSTTPFKSSK